MAMTMNRRVSDELIERWIRGDRDAAEEIYRRYYKRAWKFGLAITHREVDADDLAQEAIAHGLDVVRDPSRRPEKFTGWLLGVVKFLAWRKPRRRTGPIPADLPMEDTRHGRPTGLLAGAETAGLLSRALETLDRDERSLIEQRFVQGVTRPRLAERAGCSIDTIDRRLKTAMTRLREFLSGHFTTMVLAGDTPTMDRILRLRPSFRAAFLARHVEGLSAEKAAAKLGIPLDTLRERLKFAYETLGCSERSDFAPLRRPV
jgi:RNA polymerase sigma factor (sigma-70 family)